MVPGGTLINIPIDQWHNLVSLESGTVLLEVKDGPYVPIGEEDILYLFNNCKISKKFQINIEYLKKYRYICGRIKLEEYDCNDICRYSTFNLDGNSRLA